MVLTSGLCGSPAGCFSPCQVLFIVSLVFGGGQQRDDLRTLLHQCLLARLVRQSDVFYTITTSQHSVMQTLPQSVGGKVYEIPHPTAPLEAAVLLMRDFMCFPAFLGRFLWPPRYSHHGIHCLLRLNFCVLWSSSSMTYLVCNRWYCWCRIVVCCCYCFIVLRTRSLPHTQWRNKVEKHAHQSQSNGTAVKRLTSVTQRRRKKGEQRLLTTTQEQGTMQQKYKCSVTARRNRHTLAPSRFFHKIHMFCPVHWDLRVEMSSTYCVLSFSDLRLLALPSKKPAGAHQY